LYLFSPDCFNFVSFPALAFFHEVGDVLGAGLGSGLSLGAWVIDGELDAVGRPVGAMEGNNDKVGNIERDGKGVG